MATNPMPTDAAIADALRRWQVVLESGSARDLRSAGAQLADRLREVQVALDEIPGEREPLEGCPDCGQDTVTEHEDGEIYCSNLACGWRP